LVASAGDVVTFLTAIYDNDLIQLDYFQTTGTATLMTWDGYLSTSDVYRTAGITGSEISVGDVSEHILEAEEFVCRITHALYWKYNLQNQVATSATDDTVVKTGAGWGVDAYMNQYVKIVSGTGAGQIRKILSNTSDTLTVDRDWVVNPAAASVFAVFYVPFDLNPFKQEVLDGNGMSYYYLPYYPVQVLESVSIAGVSCTASSFYLYKDTGRIEASPSSEALRFSSRPRQAVSVSYWHGVEGLPRETKRLMAVRAAINTLVGQMGGTFDDASMITLPEASISIGQAYINIEGTVRRLQEEYNELLRRVKVYAVFG